MGSGHTGRVSASVESIIKDFEYLSLLPSIVVRASSSVYNLFFSKVPIWHAFINGGGDLVVATRTNYHRLIRLYDKHLFLTVLEPETSNVRVGIFESKSWIWCLVKPFSSTWWRDP